MDFHRFAGSCETCDSNKCSEGRTSFYVNQRLFRSAKGLPTSRKSMRLVRRPFARGEMRGSTYMDVSAFGEEREEAK